MGLVRDRTVKCGTYVYSVHAMSKTVRLPDALHEEIKSAKRESETMAETIARYFDRPHPAETREMLSSDEAEGVDEEIDEMLDDESDRLRRARETFEEEA